MSSRTAFTITINPKIPKLLERLEELADNLWYSWDRDTRTLFARIDPYLWEMTGHNPKAFLKRVDESSLLKATEDRIFMASYKSILSIYDSYHDKSSLKKEARELSERDQIAYFCFEFGFHESLPIYSGGLGILAGDHCKSASDMRLPFVAIGLLYRQGYFSQIIDSQGNQQVTYAASDFEDLPVTPVLRADGASVQITIELPQRDVIAKIWQVKIGHVILYLLDTDLPENLPKDRDITENLYGGDKTMRIEQEIILGVGGVRALQALGIQPTVWHINEGHAAFMILERIHNLVQQGLDFATALESVAVNTVFTTHTAVPAGHDHFPVEMMQTYFTQYYQRFNISHEQFMALGHIPGSSDFNMTALAIHGSRTHNGVSKIHGGVSANICRELWPEIEPEENPMDFITNGVHAPTFLAQEWSDLFDRYLGHEWRAKLCETEYWSGIDAIPDHSFWSVRQSLKSKMFYRIRAQVTEQNARNRGSEAHLDRLLKFVDPVNPNILTIGFARRFATYKRAALLFDNLDWLRKIVLDQDRPVLLLFAGKAHPADVPGQDLIRHISQIAHLPEFEGRLLLIEGYDLRLARRMVAGVDVWLNNPIYPLEASGTSGMKAGINGVINLSVLDGWWGEGYNGKNGWAIKPGFENMDPVQRDKEESRALYEILQDQVVPLYYSHGKSGYSPEWVRMAKHSMKSIMPRFNGIRMVDEYVRKFYVPASSNSTRYTQDNFSGAKSVAAWKTKIRHAWHGVTIRRLDTPFERVNFGEAMTLEVAVRLNHLEPKDVVIELLINRQFKTTRWKNFTHLPFAFTHKQEGEEHLFALKLTPDLCGRQEYFIRIYPHHSLLTHPMEMGLMKWL